MTQRTRYFLVGSGLVLAVGLCTGLVAYYGGNLPVDSASGRAEMAYIPADTAAIAFADVRHIMDSEFHQRLRAFLPTSDEKQRMLAETGIDVERDIDTVVAGLGAVPASRAAVVLIRGRFQPDRVEALAREHGATVEDYRGTRLLVQRAEAGALRPDGSAGLAFLEPTLLALGDVDGIRQAIDTGAARRGIAADRDMMRVVDSADAGDAWIVGRFEALSQHAGLAAPVRDQLAAVQWFSVSADIDEAVECRLHAQARDAEAAEQVRGVIGGMIAAARMMGHRDPRMASLLDTLQSSGVGSNIDLSFTVPVEFLDVVTDAASAHGATGGAWSR